MKWAAAVAVLAVSVSVGLLTTVFFVFAGNPSAQASCGTGAEPATAAPTMRVGKNFGPVRPAGGGVFVGGKWHYREQNGPKWTFQQVERKANEYGLPGKAMAQVAQGESSFHPYIVQHDPGDGNVGFGFFQFTPNAWGGPDSLYNQKLKALGGQKGLENIEKQFEMARFMYIATGHNLQSWHGTDFVTDWSQPRARPLDGKLTSGPIVDAVMACAPTAELDGDAKVRTLPSGGDWLKPVPGTGARCDPRIVPDVMKLVAKYKLQLGDCWACPDCGHASDGEHPLGLGLDITPAFGDGGSWELVGQLARATGWNRGCGSSGVRPACPLKKWVRFVGYDGYPNHGTGNHLHISWEHTDAAPNTPAEKVWTFS